MSLSLRMSPAPHTHDLKKTKQKGIDLSSFDCFQCLSLLYLEAHGDKIVPSWTETTSGFFFEA